MANGSEKYEAERENNPDEASDSSKKVTKVAAKAAADYFTGGKGGAIVDKVADTKLGQDVINEAAKIIDKNPILKKAAEKLDEQGAVDAADQALSLMESGGTAGGGADAAAGAAGGGKMPGSSSGSMLDSIGGSKSSEPGSAATESVMGDEQSAVDGLSSFASFDLMDIATGRLGIKVAIVCVGFFLLIIFGCIVMIAGSDENGTDPSQLHGNGSDGYCLTSNVQADDLCKLRNEGKYEEWISTFGPIAQQDYSRSGVFASITIAQAMIESGWACKDIQNNLFGIKCHGYPTCTDVNTREEYNGVSVQIVDSFRTYPSVANSIEDHSKFLLENQRYTTAGVFSARNYAEQAHALKKAGYATDSQYAQSLINQIKTYNLDRFDVIVNTSSYANCGGEGISSESGWDIRTTSPTSSDKAFTYKTQNRGQCVWYAQGRAIEIAEDLQSKGKLTEEATTNIRNTLLNTYGNGGDWYDNTRGKFKGSNNVNDVKSGSIISWKKPGGYGHVAIIEEVKDDKVTITEGWATNTTSCPTNWGCINFNSRTISLNEFKNFYGNYYTGNYKFSGYVYFLELEG